MNKIANKNSFKGSKNLKKAKEIIKLCYKKNFTNEEMIKLRYGLIPESMDDKLFIYFDNNRLYIYKSWTGNLYCILFFKQNTIYKIKINKIFFYQGIIEDIIDILNYLINIRYTNNLC